MEKEDAYKDAFEDGEVQETAEDEINQGVIITDVRIPFTSIFRLLVQVVFASIPAFIIIYLVWLIIGSVLLGILFHK